MIGLSESHQCSFSHFRDYCERLTNCLLQQGYMCKYLVSSNHFLKEHDGEYLKVQYQSQDMVILINILYSLPYAIPVLYFMVYDQECKPVGIEKMGQYFPKLGEQSVLDWKLEEGIYVSQNPITKQYMYTLNNCNLKKKINLLIPFYFDLLGLNPVIMMPGIIKQQDSNGKCQDNDCVGNYGNQDDENKTK